MITDGDTRVTYGPDGRVLNEAFETVEGHGRHATEVTVRRDVLTDLLGSAVGVAQDGIVGADLTWFGDFGDTLSTSEWDTVTSFTGHVETAGLVEFATRTYDPATRVWVQEDSFTGTVTRASSLNRYAYVEGSPVSHTDVLGAYRAASAMAAQQLSAVDYAAFMADLKAWGVAPGCYGFDTCYPSQQAIAAMEWSAKPQDPLQTVFDLGLGVGSPLPGGLACYNASCVDAHFGAGPCPEGELVPYCWVPREMGEPASQAQIYFTVAAFVVVTCVLAWEVCVAAGPEVVGSASSGEVIAGTLASGEAAAGVDALVDEGAVGTEALLDDGTALAADAGAENAVGIEWGSTRVYGGGYRENALEHIVARHTVGGARSTGNSLFSSGTTVGDIKAMVGEAVEAGTPNGALYDFGPNNVIGTTRTGAPTSQVRIYYNKDGSVASAWPDAG